jgi:hypothetical protein
MKKSKKKNIRLKRKDTRRKKGKKQILDPTSSGIVMSSMLNDESLHYLALTSKNNIGVSTSNLLKRRKKYMEKKKLENKMITFQFTNRIDSLNGGDYMYELQDFYYDWKGDRNMEIDDNIEMEYDENFDEIEREFIMTFFYPRLRYNVNYLILCPSLTEKELESINVDNLKTILDKCLSNSRSEYYKVNNDHYSLNGGFHSIDKGQFKTENKL